MSRNKCIFLRLCFALVAIAGSVCMGHAQQLATIHGIPNQNVTVQPLTHQLVCSDTSGSGTAGVCSTSPSFTPVAGDCIVYTTTTANTGTSLTWNVNSSGAVSVAKWLSSTTLAAGDVPANTPVFACYGTSQWNLFSIGNAPSGSGGGASLGTANTFTAKQTFSAGAQVSDLIQGNGFVVDSRIYSVVGDGTTDNSTNLQAAITALCGSNTLSRNLLLPTGTVLFSTGVTVPSTCTKLHLIGAGSGARTGSPGSSSGTTKLSYTGNGTAFTLGSEATPARATITSASRTSNVETVVATYNSTLATLTTSDQIMVRGLTPTDLNTEDVQVTGVTVTGTTSVTFTFASTGSNETATITSPYVDYAWNDNTYYANSASGFRMSNLALTCDSSTRTNLLNFQSYTGQQTYATTAHGIDAWRSPNMVLDHVGESGCAVGFFGTNSDEDQFLNFQSVNQHIGIWHSSQDSQTLLEFPYTSGNDIAIQLDGTLNTTIRHWTSDTDGSSTTSALTLLGTQLGRNTVGTQCYDCWFENNHGSTTSAYKSFVSIGETGAAVVTGVDFYNPMFSMPTVPTASAPQTTDFATIGNGDDIHVQYPVNINHVGNPIQPNPFFEFTGSYSPQDVFLVTGNQTLAALSGNSGTGTPDVIWNQTLGNTQWLGGGKVYISPAGTANATTTGYNGGTFGQCGSFYASGTTFTPCWQQILSVGASFANITVQPTTTGSPSVQWTWGQPVASTSGTNQSSIPMFWQYRVQHGSADVSANMKVQVVPLASGNDPAVEARFSHSGSDTGAWDFSFPAVKSVLEGSETVTFSATPTFSATTRASYMQLTGNVTSFTIAAGADGQEKTFTFCQDGTGGRTVAAPSNVVGFQQVTSTASQCTGEHFTYVLAQAAWVNDAVGSGSGSSLPTLPTTGSTPYSLTSTPSGGVGGAAAWTLPGIPGRTVSGTTDTVVAADRGSTIDYTSSSATAVTFTSPATLGNNFTVVIDNTGSGTVTLTLGAGNFVTASGSSTTLAVSSGQNCALSSPDNTNILPRCTAAPVAYTGNLITTTGLTAGNWYYMSATGLALAEANSSTTTPAICFAISTTQCQTSGIVTGLTGVTQGTTYWLSDSTAGGSVTTAPSTSGHLIQKLATGLSTTSINITPSPNVLTHI